MCGRYASTRTRSELLETFKIEEALADEEKPPDYNIAPTKTPAVVLARPPRDDKDAEPVRQLRFSALVKSRDGRGCPNTRLPVDQSLGLGAVWSRTEIRRER
jgi:putative SOS response-associated peptidase YedK